MAYAGLTAIFWVCALAHRSKWPDNLIAALGSLDSQRLLVSASTDREAWQATVHGVAKSQTGLSH